MTFFENNGTRIIKWFKANGRQMSWRDTYDPYLIWIMEIILQQTRIEQGIKYFERFIQRFPNVKSLAETELDEVLKYWEGLGYYSRARNLHAAAKQLMAQYNGIFPKHHAELIKLKGIGPYTSRAIGSFAFGNEVGVLDGNVLRVVTRVLNDFSPINEPKARRRFQETVDTWVEGNNSREFNHGIMDLGATICTPKRPACLICPLMEQCNAYENGTAEMLPVKKKLKRGLRHFHFYLLENEAEEIVVRQRPLKGLWGGLWEIPNEEVSLELYQSKKSRWGNNLVMQYKHSFTHFDMMAQVFRQKVSQNSLTDEGLRFISTEKIATLAFSKAVLNIFDKTLEGRN